MYFYKYLMLLIKSFLLLLLYFERYIVRLWYVLDKGGNERIE